MQFFFQASLEVPLLQFQENYNRLAWYVYTFTVKKITTLDPQSKFIFVNQALW